MSNITIATSLQFVKDGLSDVYTGSQTATMSVGGIFVQSPTIGTNVTSISTATLTKLGYAFVQSLSVATAATATITFGRMVGTSFAGTVQLRANEPAVLRLAAGDYAAQSAVEGSRLLVAILED